jgi:SNF2 family DNA or RNA helicase
LKVLIKLKDNFFQIIFDEKVSISVKFQLESFKLINQGQKDNYIFIGSKNIVNIDNIIGYLKNINFEVSTSSEAKKLITSKKIEIEKFQKKINYLKSLKSEKNNKNFSEFCNSFKFLARALKEHQNKSLYHLYHAGSAANFSVPGSGKTSVVLAYYQKLKIENKVDAIFVIGPTNCYHSWKDEFESTLGRSSNLRIFGDKLSPSQRKDIYNNSLKSELYASHFQTISNDAVLLKDFFSKNRFLLVVDEAHNIKKIGGVWSVAVLELSKLSEFKVILTGTPRPNDFQDFYNYLDFLYKNIEIISTYEKAQLSRFMEDNQVEKVAIFLKERLSPFFTRVTKKELNLSKAIFNKPISLQMNPIEKKIYDAIVTKIKNYNLNEYENNIDLIKKMRRARIIRLRQCCSYVQNLNTAIIEEKGTNDNLINNDDIKSLITHYDSNEKPAKLEKLKSMILDLINSNKKVLVWSTHLKSIDLILKELKNENINIKKITGSTDLDERADIKNAFNDENSSLNVIIANPQACSESISLHKACQNAIYYDISYNTAEFLQSLDRIHRVGGSENKPVYYDFLHYEKSIDEEVYKRVFKKADMQMKIIEEENLTFNLSEEDDIDDLYKEFE